MCPEGDQSDMSSPKHRMRRRGFRARSFSPNRHFFRHYRLSQHTPNFLYDHRQSFNASADVPRIDYLNPFSPAPTTIAETAAQRDIAVMGGIVPTANKRHGQQ